MNNLIEKLKQTKIETLSYFDLSAEVLNKTYDSNKWNVQYLLHHLADAETVLFDRIKRVISEPKQVLWVFDQSLWAENLNYSQVPLVLSKNVYSSVREAIIYYAEIHYEKNGQQEFVHSETGIRTLKEEFDKVAWHNQHHLAQIKQAISIG